MDKIKKRWAGYFVGLLVVLAAAAWWLLRPPGLPAGLPAATAESKPPKSILPVIRHLQQAGHEVQVSDLYAMRWKAGYDADDSGAPPVGEFWRPTLDSKQAFAQGTQSADIVAEQEKLLWADTVIFQFPLWWFSMPAIMKGWIDRVYAWGFAYGVGEHSDRHWGDRYGEGTFVGKRAMLIVTAGGWAEHYSPRGINGPIDDILFPIQHGMLFYPGFEVLPPLVFYRTDKTDAGQFADQCAAPPSG